MYKNLICFVDPIGDSFLMPCLVCNPTQTQEKRAKHQHFFIRVMKETTQGD